MPGLLAVIGKGVDQGGLEIEHRALGPLVADQKRFDAALVARFTNPKFLRDKVFQDDDEVLVALDAVIFNFAALKRQYKAQDYFQTVKAMCRQSGDRFFESFRGGVATSPCKPARAPEGGICGHRPCRREHGTGSPSCQAGPRGQAGRDIGCPPGIG